MIKKRKKFALSLKVLSLLSCIAVLSVGFASWIITGGDTEETTGNVSAETVENRKTTITIDTAGEGYDTTVLFQAHLLQVFYYSLPYNLYLQSLFQLSIFHQSHQHLQE